MPPLVPDPALVEQLRASLKLTGSEPAVQILGGSPRAFERFLMAHGHSVAKAAKAMAATLRFRKEHELDSGDAPHAAIAKVAPLWPGGKVTNTKDGSPVYFFGYGHLDPRALMRNISEAEVTAFYLHFMDGMMHETNRVNPPQCSSHTWLRPVEVHDMQGLCFAVHVAPPALLLLARVIGYGQAHIPDNVRTAVFIHAPRWFSAIWGVLKQVIPRDVQSRIEIRSDDGSRTLRPLLGGEAELSAMWQSAIRQGFVNLRNADKAAPTPSEGGSHRNTVAGAGWKMRVVDATLWAAAAAGVGWVSIARPRDYCRFAFGIMATAALFRLLLLLLMR